MKIPKFILRFAGRLAAKKLGLKEDKDMDDKKKWWQSKTVLSGIVTTLVGVYALAQANLAPSFGWTLPDIPNWIFTILGAVGIYGRVTANKAIK